MTIFREIAARSVGHLFSLFFFLFVILFISRFGFKSGIWLLIAPVPVHCFLLLSDDDSTFSSILSGLETMSLGLNTLGTK